MNITINPFQQLYFSDDIRTENNFVQLFSDEVLQTAIHPVFQGGNVVLSGTQGCGKTMILNLLRPEIRIAYAEANVRFPVNEEMRNFVSAGINLTRSRVTDFVQVTLGQGDDVDFQELPFYFADFFNYWVVRDLLDSVETIGGHPTVFESMVNLDRTRAFVRLMARQDCWFGSLKGVKTLDHLKQRLSDRIYRYRLWMNGNLPPGQLPVNIRITKTNIGEPIARSAECLWESEMLKSQIPVLIRVDQIEEMHRAFTERQRKRLLSFRKMLNRAFAARDARIHYRMGTRKYGWNEPEFLSIWGSEARLEKRRDYHLIQMDEELFAYGETKNSIFERFAIDAFQRRVSYYFRHEIGELRPDLAKSVFGKHPPAEGRLHQLTLNATDEQIDRALGLDLAADAGRWSEEWRIFLRELYRSGRSGMLDAVLASAWGRQTGGARFTRQHREDPPPENAPWKTRKWWRKERLDQAVLQLTTRCQQRFMWWGFHDVRSLSGGNITVFLHICHRVWDGFLKNESSLPPNRRTELLKGATIDRNVQAAGILFASNEWYKKLPEEPGGNARQSFAEQLGTRLNHEMMQDLRMAYPGGNGVSFPLAQFASSEDQDIVLLRSWIRDAVGYGVLFETEHSSKSKRGGRRIKFYLNPILCPRFQLPEARTKEPYYWSIEDLFALIRKAKVTLRPVQLPIQPLREEYPLLPGFEDVNA
ncbi:MAG: hypothetical protein AABN95_26080 [Acidobacteriota bacterium]